MDQEDEESFGFVLDATGDDSYFHERFSEGERSLETSDLVGGYSSTSNGSNREKSSSGMNSSYIVGTMDISVDKHGVSSYTDLDGQVWKSAIGVEYAPGFRKPTEEVPGGICGSDSLTPRNACFNCQGNHSMNQCKQPIDRQLVSQRIGQFRRNNETKNLRYHVGARSSDFHEPQPGVLSPALRRALKIGPNDVPGYVVRMHRIGYPPGWRRELVEEHSSDNDCVNRPAGLTPPEFLMKTNKLTINSIIKYPGYNEVSAGSCFRGAASDSYAQLHNQKRERLFREIEQECRIKSEATENKDQVRVETVIGDNFSQEQQCSNSDTKFNVVSGLNNSRKRKSESPPSVPGGEKRTRLSEALERELKRQADALAEKVRKREMEKIVQLNERLERELESERKKVLVAEKVAREERAELESERKKVIVAEKATREVVVEIPKPVVPARLGLVLNPAWAKATTPPPPVPNQRKPRLQFRDRTPSPSLLEDRESSSGFNFSDDDPEEVILSPEPFKVKVARVRENRYPENQDESIQSDDDEIEVIPVIKKSPLVVTLDDTPKRPMPQEVINLSPLSSSGDKVDITPVLNIPKQNGVKPGSEADDSEIGENGIFRNVYNNPFKALPSMNSFASGVDFPLLLVPETESPGTLARVMSVLSNRKSSSSARK